MRRVLRNGVRGFARGDLYRQGVRFRRGIQIIDFDEPKSRAIGISRKSELLRRLSGSRKSARFGTEPAAILDVIGKNVALELFSLAVAKQDVATRAGALMVGTTRFFDARRASVGACSANQ